MKPKTTKKQLFSTESFWDKYRDIFYIGVLLAIILKGDIVLHQWLEFGNGKKVSDVKNVLLNAFWTGGLAIFVIQILVWLEAFVKKLFQFTKSKEVS